MSDSGYPNDTNSHRSDELFQIGELSQAVGLSLKTIRYYDELGIVVPSARSAGGFRLYTRADIERFLFIKKFKPLGFSLEAVQELVGLLDRVRDGIADDHDGARLEDFAAEADERCLLLRAQLVDAELVAANIRARLRLDATSSEDT